LRIPLLRRLQLPELPWRPLLSSRPLLPLRPILPSPPPLVGQQALTNSILLIRGRQSANRVSMSIFVPLAAMAKDRLLHPARRAVEITDQCALHIADDHSLKRKLD